MAVVMETTVGDLTIDLFLKDRPRTCLNFIKLCKMKFYNLNLIFSIEENFIAQMGDPTGTGRGGESIYRSIYGEQAQFYEGEKVPIVRHIDIGTVSMVSCGDGTYGSQFFITLGENLDSLDEKHLVFGHITEGMDVVDALNATLTDGNNRPYKDIYITHMVILNDPYPDPKELVIPDMSPEPSGEIMESRYIAAHEDLEDDVSDTEIAEEIAANEAEARATILEMVGDLPDADMAPPENVLFVCKLNPVTTSEDLEIIFSRFGKIISCEVIADKISGRSLQYAFIEYPEQKCCENAYFKMDNVLIDERRIHVDFSQSVSKYKWRGKGRGVDHFDDKGRKIDENDAKHTMSNENSRHDKREKSKKDDRLNKEKYSDKQGDDKRKKDYYDSRNGRGREKGRVEYNERGYNGRERGKEEYDRIDNSDHVRRDRYNRDEEGYSRGRERYSDDRRGSYDRRKENVEDYDRRERYRDKNDENSGLDGRVEDRFGYKENIKSNKKEKRSRSSSSSSSSSSGASDSSRERAKAKKDKKLLKKLKKELKKNKKEKKEKKKKLKKKKDK